MNRLPTRNSNQGMTLLEVLVVILVTILVVAMIMPMRSQPDRAPIYHCLNNVKQIDLGFLMYAEDNNGKFPIQTSITNGGSMEFLERNQTFPHFQKLSQYIYYLPTLVCPADKNRQAATSYEHLADTNLSYFLNADVPNRTARSIMSGERHLKANGQPLGHGTFALRTNMNLGWTRELHRNVGVLGFADGHAEIGHEPNLNPILQQQGLATLHLSIP